MVRHCMPRFSRYNGRMSAITFDTLRYAQRLREAGVPAAQAEAEASALADVFATGLGEVATRQDLDALRTAVKSDIDARINEAKSDIVKWVAGLLLGQAAPVAALVKLL